MHVQMYGDISAPAWFMSAIGCFALYMCIYTCTKIYRCIDVDMDADIDIDIDIDISCVCDGGGFVCGESVCEREREGERKRERKKEKFACFMRAMSCFAVVPRTIESSTRTTILSLTTACIGLNLHRTLRSRCSCHAGTSQIQPGTSQDVYHPVSQCHEPTKQPDHPLRLCNGFFLREFELSGEGFLVLARRRRVSMATAASKALEVS